MPAYFANYRTWKASSHSPLVLDPPNMAGLRRATVIARAGHADSHGSSLRFISSVHRGVE
jgi:hypothetical protein